ncbi:hypothetical protein TNCV_3010481 [Trichonephila clavipes]|nr:hypothetical protein TNCV_3010481 [Trichonephila clavipes]
MYLNLLFQKSAKRYFWTFSQELMTTRKPTEPFGPIYPQNEGYQYHTSVEEVQKKEEHELSVQLGRHIIKELFKKYLSNEYYRLEIFLEDNEVKNPSFLLLKENYLYGLNKVLIRAILKNKSFDSEYLAIEDEAVMQELGCALKELHDDTTIEKDHFLIAEMETFEIAEAQKIYRLKESNANQMQKSSS